MEAPQGMLLETSYTEKTKMRQAHNAGWVDQMSTPKQEMRLYDCQTNFFEGFIKRVPSYREEFVEVGEEEPIHVVPSTLFS